MTHRVQATSPGLSAVVEPTVGVAGVPLEEPPSVVAFDERGDHLPGLLEALEVVEIQARRFLVAWRIVGGTKARRLSSSKAGYVPWPTSIATSKRCSRSSTPVRPVAPLCSTCRMARFGIEELRLSSSCRS